MKTFTRITLLAAAFATGLSAINAAEATPAPTGTTTPASAAKHPRLRAMMAFRNAMKKKIAKKLGLTADQIAQLKTDRTKTVAAVKTIRADTRLTADQKKAKVREALQTARTEMRSVLTPDQQAQLDKMRQKKGAGA